MRYNKFLIIASLLITKLAVAACSGTSCFNDGISYGGQFVPSANDISNSLIESAVGKDRVNSAKSTQEAIQGEMGGNFRNVDGMTNAGNKKTQNCVGKKTPECDALNYYNDPLMRQKQQGIESSVGMASYLLNKQIQQNVDFKSYCQTHPTDSLCKMCQENPNQSMCQDGNKCTTITYQSAGTSKDKFSCEIKGQRGYHCNKWVEDVTFHWVPGNYVDGAIVTPTTKPNQCVDNLPATSILYNDSYNKTWIRVYTRTDDINNKFLTVLPQHNDVTHGRCYGENGRLFMERTTQDNVFSYIKSREFNGGGNYSFAMKWIQKAGENCNANGCVFNIEFWSGTLQDNKTDITNPYIMKTTITTPPFIEKSIVIDSVPMKDNCNQ